jgi:hypothetical protein
MADLERAKAAWAAAFAVWESGYVKEAAPLAGLLADQASVPLDPFPDDGHSPCRCPCSTASPGRMSVTWKRFLPGPQPQRRSRHDCRLAPHRLNELDAHGEDVGYCQPAGNLSAPHYRPASVLAHPGRQGRSSRIQPPSRPVPGRVPGRAVAGPAELVRGLGTRGRSARIPRSSPADRAGVADADPFRAQSLREPVPSSAGPAFPGRQAGRRHGGQSGCRAVAPAEGKGACARRPRGGEAIAGIPGGSRGRFRAVRDPVDPHLRSANDQPGRHRGGGLATPCADLLDSATARRRWIAREQARRVALYQHQQSIQALSVLTGRSRA